MDSEETGEEAHGGKQVGAAVPAGGIPALQRATRARAATLTCASILGIFGGGGKSWVWKSINIGREGEGMEVPRVDERLAERKVDFASLDGGEKQKSLRESVIEVYKKR